MIDCNGMWEKDFRLKYLQTVERNRKNEEIF
jgi:hypothetical protein